MENKKTIFYREWLPLPKEQFRILLHLARNGSFSGNLSDLCRYFSLDPQTKNRNNVRGAIEALTKNGFIECNKSGRTYNLKLIPKEEEINLPSDWVDAFTNKAYCVSVSKEAMIKVLLWLTDRGAVLFTNEMIAAELKVSVSTIDAAKKVLKEDFEAIIQQMITVKNTNGDFRRIGQVVNVVAWLKE